MPLKDTALAVLVMAIWGFNFVVARVGVESIPPVFLMFLRFTLVAAMLLPFVRVPRGKLWGIAGLSVVLGGLHFPLIFSGMVGVDAATAAVAAQLQVPFSSLLAAVFFRDYLGWRRFVGMVVAFGGIVVIAGAPHAQDNLFHLGLIIAAGFAFAIANVQIKRIGEVDGFTMNAWMALFAAPQVLAASLLLESGQWEAVRTAPPIAWAALAFLVLGATMTAYGLWYRLVRVHPVNQTTPFLLLVPVFGVLSGVLVLGEPMTLHLAAGGALTIAGVAVILIRRPRTVEEKAAAPT